jgi:hypothetical protein
MRKTVLVLLTVWGLSLFVWAQEPTGFTGSRNVVLTEEGRVGSQVLPAGTYKVTHVMEGAEHIMVFTQNQKEFRVKCNLEPLTEKAKATMYWYDDSVRNQPMLQWIEFRGDDFRHVFR